jgi:hypothetical protein
VKKVGEKTGEKEVNILIFKRGVIMICQGINPELGNRYRYNALATFSGQWAEWK